MPEAEGEEVESCLAILTSNEECHLLRSTTCLGENVYMCYDYVRLDNLSDISAYRTIVKPKRTAMHNAILVKDTYGLKPCALRKSLYVYDSVVNSILNWPFKIRKV